MEVGLVNHFLAHHEDIDIKCPWPPTLRADPARPGLEVLGNGEELPRVERRVGSDDGVEVLRLFGTTDGFRLVDRRHPDDGNAVGRCEPVDGALEVGQTIAEVGSDSELGAAGPIGHCSMHTAT